MVRTYGPLPFAAGYPTAKAAPQHHPGPNQGELALRPLRLFGFLALVYLPCFGRWFHSQYVSPLKASLIHPRRWYDHRCVGGFHTCLLGGL